MEWRDFINPNGTDGETGVLEPLNGIGEWQAEITAKGHFVSTLISLVK